MDQPPDSFWIELQVIIDSNFMAGWNPKHVMYENVSQAESLSFGAPLNGNAELTKHFELVKQIGQKIIKPYGDFLSRTQSLVDKVVIIANSDSIVSSPISCIDSRELHSDFTAGLLGYVMEAGVNPSVHHWGINSTRELARNKIILAQDSGTLNPKLVEWLGAVIYDAFNTGAFAFLKDISDRRAIFDDVIANVNLSQHFKIIEKPPRVNVFGRKAPGAQALWITVKSGQLDVADFHIAINELNV